jgi:hypothetical protein
MSDNKKPVGRPRMETYLNPMWKEIILECGRQGKHITDFLVQLGISWEGHYTLLKRNKPYSETVQEYHKLCENYWFEMARKNMEKNGGNGFNSRLWSLIMRNKFGNNWSESTKVDVTTNGEQINGDNKIQVEIIKPKDE